MNFFTSDLHQTDIHDPNYADIGILLHNMGATVRVGANLDIRFRYCKPSDFRISRGAKSFVIENTVSPEEHFDPMHWWRFPRLDIMLPSQEHFQSLRLEADHSGLIVSDVSVHTMSLQIIDGSCKLNRVMADETSIHIDSGSIRWHGQPNDISLDCKNGSANIHGMPSDFGYDANLRNGHMRLGSRRLWGGSSSEHKTGAPYAAVTCQNGTVSID
ncbi:DUF4097 family beta strand repeat-containing protein [Bifidobacterium aquikefiricola]|uniref:DUF4097 family beta strand repeat-containing protein n=1 Tax=Bifidobacterium aquikefiricola TaxID=3059038 RepID=A0AB39U852_9BIFI